MNGGMNCFLDSPNGSFDFRDMIISRANGEPDVGEGSAKGVIFAIAMDFHWVETTSAVEIEVRCNAGFENRIGTLTDVVARQVTNVT